MDKNIHNYRSKTITIMYRAKTKTKGKLVVRRSAESALVDQFPHSLQAEKPNISHGKIGKLLKADSI